MCHAPSSSELRCWYCSTLVLVTEKQKMNHNIRNCQMHMGTHIFGDRRQKGWLCWPRVNCHENYVPEIIMKSKPMLVYDWYVMMLLWWCTSKNGSHTRRRFHDNIIIKLTSYRSQLFSRNKYLMHYSQGTIQLLLATVFAAQAAV